jgi:hypothetical protein
LRDGITRHSIIHLLLLLCLDSIISHLCKQCNSLQYGCLILNSTVNKVLLH